jgi:hypothetical protein
MGKMLILEPQTIVALVEAGYNGQFGSGAANLLTPSPKEVWQGNAAGDHGIFYVDLGAFRDVDTFFLGGLRAGGTLSGSWEVAKATGMAPGGEVVLSPLQALSGPAGKREPFPAFVRLAAPVNGRYFRIRVVPGVGLMTIGVVAIGLAFEPVHNREKGGGRVVIDTGAVEALRDGGFGIGHGTRKGGFRWTFGDLGDDELEKLHDLAWGRGTTRPVIVVEDPDVTAGLNERIHYGLFDRFEFYERGDPGKHRWALSMTEWT